MPFQPFDTVRVVRLLESEREVSGSLAESRQPRIGETGTVVADVGDDLYLVEQVTADGLTVWMAEFAAEELELVSRPPGNLD